ncbi:MAG: mannonate dehydratase [Candidatus Acidiferrales bacterium]
MDRRKFLHYSSLAAAGGAAASWTPATSRGARKLMAAPAPNARPKLGTQFGRTPPDDTLRVLAELGVSHMCSGTPSPRFDENWSVEGLTGLRKKVESYGIKLEMVQLPLPSSPIERAAFPAILLGKSPERDQEIGQICQMIRNVSRAGIPSVKYNFTVLGVVRTKPTRDRGGALYSTFNYAEAKRENLPLTEAGHVSAEEYWDRITYFLKRVVPVAEECKVKMACHPQDPGLPKAGFRGVQAVLSNVDGLKRFVEIMPSAYHGLNFCQGTVSEMLPHPGTQIYDVIRYFGVRRKIFNVHFRNIRGGFLNFEETFPDNGSVNMVKAMRTYKEVGYDAMIMPDHAPRLGVPDAAGQAFAFEYGYIRGLLQAVYTEA